MTGNRRSSGEANRPQQTDNVECGRRAVLTGLDKFVPTVGSEAIVDRAGLDGPPHLQASGNDKGRDNEQAGQRGGELKPVLSPGQPGHADSSVLRGSLSRRSMGSVSANPDDDVYALSLAAEIAERGDDLPLAMMLAGRAAAIAETRGPRFGHARAGGPSPSMRVERGLSCFRRSCPL
jgi:hypothetical protein